MVAALALPSAVVAPAAVQPAWWRYVERGRTHEVLAQWREREGRFELRETSPLAPDARIDERFTIRRPWEARVALWQLECRLASLGAYWQQRATDASWRRLGAPPGAPTPDRRRNLVIEPLGAAIVHHYHDAHGGGDQLLSAVKVAPARYGVLRAQIDVPSLNIGRIDILHSRVPDTLAQSLILREQLVLTQAGMGKLVTRDDYGRSFGHAGESRAARIVQEVIERVRDGRLERPERRMNETEEYAEFLLTLNDPRLRALHQRFLTTLDESELLTAGPVAIRKAVSAKRATCDHNHQHLLTLLEASLLAREKLRNGTLSKGDAEVRALAHLAYYL